MRTASDQPVARGTSCDTTKGGRYRRSRRNGLCSATLDPATQVAPAHMGGHAGPEPLLHCTVGVYHGSPSTQGMRCTCVSHVYERTWLDAGQVELATWYDLLHHSFPPEGDQNTFRSVPDSDQTLSLCRWLPIILPAVYASVFGISLITRRPVTAHYANYALDDNQGAELNANDASWR